MTSRRYVVLDVFTGSALAGNPLAVVLDCDGLDGARMQAIAHEFNLSETVFVLRPEHHAHRARLRIFTPRRELPFAGHPTVGTAVLLASLEGQDNPGHPVDFVLEEEVGPITCEVRPTVPARATFRLPRLPEEVGPAADDASLAAAFGLSPEDVGVPGHVPSRYSAGNPFTFVPVSSLETLSSVRCNPPLWGQAFGDIAASAYLYTTEATGASAKYHARMFTAGDREDPATGSAAAAFAGVVMRFDKPHDGRHAIVIQQGVEMGRPSRIELGIEVAGGTLRGATIGGAALVVAEGRLFA